MADDRAALLRELHDVHAPSLWRFVVRLTGDDRFAEDVVQETLLRAWRRPQILTEDEAGARAWLFTVARNLVIDDRRSARVNREVASDDLPERPSADHANAVLDAWLVSDSLAQLSDDHRQVIVRAYYGRRTVTDIAAELDIPAGTVKSRLHYGLRALKLALQERGVTKE
ncbi:sigma-70 family RNA polymerase sigma factor [Kribbella qitaiheensis]|uniref:RNA polymerase sigma factor n=1 Tax=Kribbella qitaiheensis TaxID=1544730 RepID=A0A7G6X2K3_9ACTN|nr:sigma-70 family RNA polymerase sigma factor [Kribbella qitaiheensis]QNE20468.1 sigma-70 family RNA polymerase sigma factor [Kribbella qitaiheensis]